MKQKKSSPKVNATKSQITFDFSVAVSKLNAGKKIRRLEWEDKNEYGVMKDGFLMIHRPDGKDYIWKLSDGDLEATDWMVIE